MHDQESAHPATLRRQVAGPVFRDALQLIAEGVTEIVGFRLATISVVRPAPDGTQELEVIADAGDDAGNEVIVGRRTPLASLLMEIEKAEVWGQFRFLPHELLETEDVENAYGWVVPDIEPIDAPDAWHPLDLLVALLHDDQGVLRGTLAIDLPENGRRPGPEQRRHAGEVRRAGRPHRGHHPRARGARRAGAARRAPPAPSSATPAPSASSARSSPSASPASSTGSGPTAPGSRPSTRTAAAAARSTRPTGPRSTSRTSWSLLAEPAARQCWRDQTAVVIAATTRCRGARAPSEQRSIVSFLDSIGVGSLLFVPLGAGAECLGNLVLTRSGASEWTELDRQAALDIGHDLGRVILNARTFQREHELVVELQALDTYKSQLIATVSHELKNPLTAITGYLEILDGDTALAGRPPGPPSRRWTGAPDGSRASSRTC